MVSFTVRMKFSPDDRADVTEALRSLALASRQETGSVTFIPHLVEGDPDTVVIYEQWRDASALEAHGQSAHFKKYAVGVLYQRMRERAREDLAAVV
ncbi:MAG: putative quinol monooxygenase [Terracidiphilus sp.]|jgi:quinol monooxygenase YgiN